MPASYAPIQYAISSEGELNVKEYWDDDEYGNDNDDKAELPVYLLPL
jgi:hypothetical protein